MIKVEHLVKKFDARGIAGLSDISFSIRKGEVMGLMGPNGSGKTTLLKILTGSLKADGGQVSSDGLVSLFPSITISEDANVQKFLISKVALDIDEEKKLQLTRDLADTFEFTFQLRQKLSELSSGQKQKVLLAAELINRPTLLLMDEPFTHLDPFTRRDILNGLFQYIRQQGITVLWVTHELEEAFKYSDTLGLMNFGKLEQLSPAIELLQKPRNLFVAQFLGYQNFFPVKFENGVWLTPWGTWEKDFLAHSEAILVIPDEAWKLDQSSNFSVTVSERYPTRQGMEYRLTHEERILTLKLGPQDRLLDLNTKVSLFPRWEACFLIPL